MFVYMECMEAILKCSYKVLLFAVQFLSSPLMFSAMFSQRALNHGPIYPDIYKIQILVDNFKNVDVCLLELFSYAVQEAQEQYGNQCANCMKGFCSQFSPYSYFIYMCLAP